MNRVFARLAAVSVGLVAPAVLAAGAMAATCPHQVPAPCRPHDPVVVTVRHPDPGGPCRHGHHSHHSHPSCHRPPRPI